MTATDANAAHGVRLNLLRGFELRVDGVAVDLPISAQRLVANLALHERPRARAVVASSLWIDLPEQRAAANLRTALWRLRRFRDRVVTAPANRLSLEPGVEVDVSIAEREARVLIAQRRAVQPAHAGQAGQPGRSADAPLAPGALTLDSLSGDLLPDWDEDWVLYERERLRQLRLHALEALSERFREQGRYAEAVEAGLSAVSADPLRESAHRVLIEAHLAEGNVVEARRQLDRCRALLWDALSIRLSADLVARVAHPSAGTCRCSVTMTTSA